MKPREPVVVQALGPGVREGGERPEGGVGIRKVLGEAAAVVDQHPDRDRVTAFSGNQPRKVPADRSVKTDQVTDEECNAPRSSTR
ncbi:hypothetical protein SAVCW2_61360 [Streptomyces avermitilis]|nr:hypothetical protein SAVCW2_61360 [Streptomyces avermitilis]